MAGENHLATNREYTQNEKVMA